MESMHTTEDNTVNEEAADAVTETVADSAVENSKNSDVKGSGQKTLLTSVILSSPGPLVLGIGLIFGKSTTQLSDFVRRTAELLAIIMSYVVYKRTHKDLTITDDVKAEMERKTNLFVGIVMCISGSLMILVTLLSKNTDKGNVVPAFSIAFVGLIVNFIFWRKYSSLYKKEGNSILRVQGRLYGAKSLVDSCITASLLSILVLPGTDFSYWFDKVGSVIVAGYLVFCGIKTVKGAQPSPGPR